MTRDQVLIATLRDGGIFEPSAVLADSRAAGLTLTDCATLLELESSGGANVFGRDHTLSIPDVWKGEAVTFDRYTAYRHAVDVLGQKPQGVGSTQLTYKPYQLEADRLGGCWKTSPNRRVGFGILRDNITASSTYDAYGMFNGGPTWEGKPAAVEYARKASVIRAVWRKSISDALDKAGY